MVLRPSCRSTRLLHRFGLGISCAVLAFLVINSRIDGGEQKWVWTKEVADTSGRSMSLAADAEGNVHMSYGAAEGRLKYAFRPAGPNSKWFAMVLGGGVAYTNLKVDAQNNPHICSTYLSLPLRYFHYDGKNWTSQEIAPEDTNAVPLACSVAISSDGTPRLSWYRLVSGEHMYAHLRYAELREGAWMMRTVDYDMQTGKWNSMILDSQGNPIISYDAFVKGLMKIGRWNGTEWAISVVDSRGAHGTDYSLGMGSSVVMDAKGFIHVVYYSDSELRHAWKDENSWKVEVVDRITPTGAATDYRSSILVDRDGILHVSYEDFGVLKHAYWDGTAWRVEVIARNGLSSSRFSAMTIDSTQNILYIAYTDPIDKSLKVAVGRKVEPLAEDHDSSKKEGKN